MLLFYLHRYNNTSKKEEKQVLVQGITLAPPPMAAQRPLPAPVDRPHTLSAPVHDEQHAFSFRTPENTAQQAKMRHPTFVLIPSSTPLVNIPPQRPRFVKIAPRPPPMARSTLHYRLKVEREQADSGSQKTKKYKPRTKGTTCGKCKKLRDNSTHSQYYGVWFCEETATESKEQWLRSQEERRRAKKEEKAVAAAAKKI